MNQPTIKIRVTRKDIKFAERGKCANCPVARALYRITKKQWWVGPNVAITMPAIDGGLLKRIQLTDEMKKFIRLFDGGRGASPTTFTLPISSIQINHQKFWR